MDSENAVEQKKLLKEIVYLRQLINDHKKNNTRKTVLIGKSPLQRSVLKSKRFQLNKPNSKKSSGIFITASQDGGASISQARPYAKPFFRNTLQTVTKYNDVNTVKSSLRKVTFQNSRRVVPAPEIRTIMESTPMGFELETPTSVTASKYPTSVSYHTSNQCQNPYQLVKINTGNRESDLLYKVSSVKMRVVSVNEGDLTVKIANKSKTDTNLNQIVPPLNKSNNSEKRNVIRTRIVCSPTVKQPSRLVLKSSQYKWNAVNKPVLSNSLKLRSPTQNIITSGSKGNEQGNKPMASASSFKYIRNTISKSNNITRNIPSKPKKSTIKTKYKLIRKEDNSARIMPSVKTKYKLVNKKTTRVSPYKFVRKVGKYSIKYIQVSRSKNYPFSNYFGKPRKSPFNLHKRSVHKYVKNQVIKRLSRKFKNVSTRSSSKLVMIGGMLYNSTPNRLSRTDKQGSYNKIKITTLTRKKPNVVIVRGVKFLMDSSGKTLKRIQENQELPNTGKKDFKNSPKVARVDLGGKTYIQSEPGILVQSQSTHKRSLASQAVNRSINRLASARKKSTQYCMFFNRFGRCYKKDEGKCPYIHDPDKIAVCTRFLKGNCTMENCPFSHKICRSKMPACSFFLRGLCNSDNCPYLHVNVNPKAETCQDFLKGYCPLGSECKKHHRFSCPQFQRMGTCDLGDKCPLKHIKHKSKKRKLTEIKVCEESKCASITSIQSNNSEIAEESTDEELPTKHRRLPSFIKLSDDDSDEEETVELAETKPLRIKPQFLIK